MDPEKKPITPGDLLRGASQNSDAKNPHEDEPQVYNVMPRLTHKSAAAQPAVQVSDTSLADNSIEGLASQTPVSTPLLKYLKIFILVAAVAGLAFASYRFGPKYYKQLFGDKNSTNQDLVQNSDQNAQSASTPEPPPSNVNALPVEWLKKYFGAEKCDAEKETECGPQADPDLDGMSNLEESQQNTDPNNADSDGDGLSDGDEVYVFSSNPLKKYSFDDPQYSDSDYLKGGYDLNTTQLATESKLLEIKSRMQEKGLHPPTITTLGDALRKIYDFGDKTIPILPIQATSTPSSTPDQALSGLETTPEAQQDRDAQRTTTIKNIGIGLVKYYETNNAYPKTTNFKEMYDSIRVFMKIATNPQDPVNKEPYVYAYTSNEAGNDFTLSFYSEVVKQLIKKHAADAQKDKITEEAAILDDQRMNDLKRLQTALLLYSTKQSAGNQNDVFPSVEKYKTELLANGDISDIPRDPKTLKDYEYKVSDTFDTFTVKAVLDNPPNGSTGYLCNQLDCDYY